jgi:hypothetical protein
MKPLFLNQFKWNWIHFKSFPHLIHFLFYCGDPLSGINFLIVRNAFFINYTFSRHKNKVYWLMKDTNYLEYNTNA